MVKCFCIQDCTTPTFLKELEAVITEEWTCIPPEHFKDLATSYLHLLPMVTPLKAINPTWSLESISSLKVGINPSSKGSNAQSWSLSCAFTFRFQQERKLVFKWGLQWSVRTLSHESIRQISKFSIITRLPSGWRFPLNEASARTQYSLRNKNNNSALLLSFTFQEFALNDCLPVPRILQYRYTHIQNQIHKITYCLFGYNNKLWQGSL